jgi:hypothetical protein
MVQVKQSLASYSLRPNPTLERTCAGGVLLSSLFFVRGARRSTLRYASCSLSLSEVQAHSEIEAFVTMSARQPSMPAEPITVCHADTFASTSSSWVSLPAVALWRYARSSASSAPVMAHQAGSIGSSSPNLRHGPLATPAAPIYVSANEHEPSHNKPLQRTRAGVGHLYRSQSTQRAVARR